MMMKISASDDSEFVDQLFTALGGDVEIHLTEEAYEDCLFDMPCDKGFKRIDFGAQKTIILADTSLALCGEKISLHHVIFRSPRLFNSVFSAQAAESLTISNCIWSHNFLAEQPGLSILHIEPRSMATRLSFTDCWFLRNQTNEGHHILGFRSSTAGSFASMHFERTAFIDNRADFVIGALSADMITVQDCFIFVRDDQTTFLGARTKGATIRFSGCTIIAPSMSQIASQWAGHLSQDDFNPVTFEDCHIYLTADERQPPGMKLVGTAVSRIEAMDEEHFSSWLVAREEAARAGQSPSAAEMRRSLMLE